MNREYHHWWSHRVGMEMGVVVYGHYGMPLVGFPTSAGDEWELENQGMIGALAPRGRQRDPKDIVAVGIYPRSPAPKPEALRRRPAIPDACRRSRLT